MRIYWLIPIALLGAVAALAAEDCVVVDGDRILAKHFAEANAVFAQLPAETPLGHSPYASVKRVVTAAQLRRIARTHRLQLESAAPVCFVRAGEMLTAERVRQTLLETLDNPEVRLELIDYSRRRVPRGDLRFSLAGLSSPSNSDPDKPVLWRGTVHYGERRNVSVWARVRLSAPQRQVLAMRDLPPGEPISGEDVVERTVDTFPATDPPIASLEHAIGTLPRRRIRAGEALRSSWLKLPNEVERGALVVVEVNSGSARLRFEAKAESSGRLGDPVWVRNPDSGHRFTATVAGKGRVTVQVSRGRTS
ncbi:MAG: flagellar basal body P-ring formation protein FlgA [bacterium]|nr:flagellar basal body P-ring formation protein FlgA [bacterium]